MLSRSYRYILITVWLILLSGLSALSAQEFSSVDTCADLRFLMRTGTTPDMLLQGGGVLQAGVLQMGEIGPNDIGDHWIFQVDDANSDMVARLNFDGIRADLPLEYAVFYGASRITPGNHYAPVSPGQTYTVPTTSSGIYTVVVQLQQIETVENLSQPVGYQITANYEGRSNNINTALRSLRDEQTSTEFTLDSNFRLDGGKQVITFPSGAEVRINPNGIRSVSTRPNAAAQIFFEPQGSLLLDSWAQTISTLGGNLSVIGTVDEKPRIFYLENFGYGATLSTPIQSSLNDIIDSNGTHIATDWEGISGLWLMSDCVGFKLNDGRTFTAMVDAENIQREFIVQANPAESAGCSDFYISVDALDLVGATIEHQVCLTWEPIESGTEVSLNRSILKARLIEERSITLQSNAIRMLPLDSSPLPLNIELGDQGVTIKLDWENLQSFEYQNQTISFAFLDSPRTTTTRDGENLLSLEALNDVIDIVYKGENARELLMLPAEESYIELVTPAGEPTFNGSAFNGTALPDEPGYQPRALNNLGGECYPVNTLLEDVNCAPNGEPNPANGNLWYSVTDHVAYNPVFDLALTRSYNSYDYAVDGAFGLGWTSDFPLDYNVRFDSAANARVIDLANAGASLSYRLGLDPTWAARGIVSFTTTSGSQHSFVRKDNAGGTGEIYVALTMPGWALSRAGATRSEILRSGWILTQDSGLTYTFDRAGRLRSFGYPAQGHQISIAYPWATNYDGPGALGESQPVIISDDILSRQLELYYDDDHHIIRSILRDMTVSAADATACLQEESCFETTYRYTNGLLTGVVYPGGQTATYEYDLLGRLIRHDDPRAPMTPVMGYVYADETGGALAAAYLLRSGEAASGEDSFLWRGLSVNVTNDERQVTVTREYGNQQTYVYRLEGGQLTQAGDSYTLIRSTSPLAEDDPQEFEAAPTTYTWENGLLIGLPRRLLPGTSDRGRNSIEFGYTLTGQLQTLRGGYPGFDITATTTQTQPIPLTSPQAITFADGTQMRFDGYNDGGFFSDFTDTQGAHYQFERDERNRPIRITRTNDGMIWEYTYDSSKGLGLLQSIRQLSAAPDDPGYTITYGWDGLGRLVSVTDGILGDYRIDYVPMRQDDSGEFFSRIDVIDPAGAMTVSRFDGRNRLTRTVLLPSADVPFVRRTIYGYDEADLFGRLSWMVESTSEEESLTTTYSYQPERELNQVGEAVFIGGTRVTITDAYGRTKFMVYDVLGRIRLMSESPLRVTRFDYEVTEPENPNPNPTINQNGLRIIQRDFLAGEEIARTTSIFDLGWQLTGVTQIEGNPLDAESPGWTGEWRLLTEGSTVNPNIRRLQAPNMGLPDVVWEGSYINGRAGSVNIKRTNPLTNRQEIDPNLAAQYDFLGRPTRITQTVDSAPQVINLAYCPQNAGGLKILRSHPNAEISCDDPNAASVLFYDAHERLVRADSEFESRTFTYAPDVETGGSIVQMKASADSGTFTWMFAYDAAGDMTSWTDEHGVTRRYEYDRLGRLLYVAVDGAPHETMTYTYNTADLLTSAVDGLGRGSVYAYNSAGQLILRQDIQTGDSISYTYNAKGLLDSVISPLGIVTTYEYQDRVDPTRLTAIINAAGRNRYDWNDSANTLTYTDARGKQTIYTFDSLGALWRINRPQNRQYDLIYDAAGNLTEWRTSGESARNMLLNYEFANYQIGISAEDVEGWGWDFMLSPSSQLLSVENAPQPPLSFQYDALGKLFTANPNGEDNLWTLQHSDQRPEIAVSDGFHNESTLRFDSLYRLVQSQSSDATTDYGYYPTDDGILNLRQSSADVTRIYTFSPGDDRQPPKIAVRGPGQRTLYTYNAEGLLEDITRETCLQEPYFNLDSVSPELYTIDGQPVCEDDEAQNVWRANFRFRYDTLGRLIRTINEEQNVEAFSYDDAGNLVSYQNEDGKTYNYIYDDLNRLTRISGPAGVDIILSYDLDQVTGVCQALTERSLSYDACAAENGVLESYNYDALGLIVTQAFDQTSIPYTYNGGALTKWGETELGYSPDALSLLTSIGDYTLEYAGLEQLSAVSGQLKYGYDANGRLSIVQAGTQQLIYDYDDSNLSYSIRDEQTGATLTFSLFPSGLLQSVQYAPGESEESTPVLSVEYGTQDESGITPFTLFWGDDYAMDFYVNRQGDDLRIDYIPMGEGFIVDNVLSPTRLTQRQAISSFDPAYFMNGAEGYIIVLGYDQNDNLLTMRINDSGGNRLLYQVTFVYTEYSQLDQEVRQYGQLPDEMCLDENGARKDVPQCKDVTQVVIDYQYGEQRNQLLSRTVTINTPQNPPQAAGVIALALLGGIAGLSRRKRYAPLFMVIAVGLAGFSTFLIVGAQDNLATLRFAYTYDNQGNMNSVSANGTVCGAYTYDGANRLIEVQRGENMTAYRYDVYNRVIEANGQQFVYHGANRTPFMITENGGAAYHVQSADGVPLFSAQGDEIAPYIYGGSGQAFGTRSYGESETPNAVWLFDPFGRYLTLTAPTDTPDPCLLLAAPDSWQGFQVIGQDQLWDTQNNLVFTDARVYVPELARFLQRDPLGPDALGNVYDYPPRRGTPPVQRSTPQYGEGLRILNQALEIEQTAAAFTAESIKAHHQPAPTGMRENAFVDDVLQPALNQREELSSFINLPNWLANNFNLPGAQIDPTNGALRLLEDNAPGQGGWGTARQLDFGDAIWGNSQWIPSQIVQPQARLASLVDRMRLPAYRFTTYLNRGWQARNRTLADTWESIAPRFSVDRTPAALLQHLPRPLGGYRSAESVIGLVETLDQLPFMTGEDWLQQALDDALPTPPDLPPADAAAYRDQWFTDDTLGIATTLSRRWPVKPAPKVLDYGLGVNFGWLGR